MATGEFASYCRICPALCGVIVQVEDDLVVGVRGDRAHPVSQGYTCPKGRRLPQEVHAPDRLRSALRRRSNGEGRAGFEPVSLDQATREIASKLRRIIDEHGPRSVALYVGTRGYEVLPLAGATAWLDGIGSPSFYSTYTIDQPGKDLARAIHGSWPAGFQDFSSSDVVMLVGNNPLVSGFVPYIAFPATNARPALRAHRQLGRSLIVIDPRRTETAELADIHLQPRPGFDSEIVAAMLHVILRDGATDAEFVASWASGIEELQAVVEPFTPEMVGSCAGLEAADIVAAARLFASGPRGCAVAGTGTNMAPNGTLAEYLLLCLNSVCGRYRRAGDAVPNAGVLTAGRGLAEGARAPRQIWGDGPQPRFGDLRTMYGQMPSSTLADEILEPGEGQVRALIVSGGNPLVALPDHAKARRALQSLDLLVTLDIRMTQTVALSHYVIACRHALEKADTTLGSDLRFPVPFAQYAAPVIEPEGELVEEWEFFWSLARELGTPWDLGRRIGMPIPILAEGGIAADRKPTAEELWAMLCASGRVTLEDLRAHPHGWSPPQEPVMVGPARTENRDRLQLADPSMMRELTALARRSGTGGSPRPYVLTSRRLWDFHNSWGQDIEELRGDRPPNPLRVHPDDLAADGLAPGSIVTVTSDHGEVTAVVEADRTLRRGVVTLAHCWGGDDPLVDGACSNELVSSVADVGGIVGMPRMSAIAVSVRARPMPLPEPMPDH